jgi:hypothetical protein
VNPRKYSAPVSDLHTDIPCISESNNNHLSNAPITYADAASAKEFSVNSLKIHKTNNSRERIYVESNTQPHHSSKHSNVMRSASKSCSSVPNDPVPPDTVTGSILGCMDDNIFEGVTYSPGAMGLNLELRVKVFFSADSGTLGVAFHHPGG